MLDIQNLDLENFLDNYISHTKILKPLYVANRMCKEILLIPSKDLTRKGISEENKELRNNLAKKFLKLFQKRKYKKDFRFYIAS